MNNNKRKDEALGMPHGTAGKQLRKMVLFNVLQRHRENFCFKCGSEIETVAELSIEHKQPWLYADNPKETFFDLTNIAFSHLSCNRPHQHGAVQFRKVGPEGTAWCRMCQDFLPVSSFWKDSSRWNGIEETCQRHSNERRKERRTNRISRGLKPQ